MLGDGEKKFRESESENRVIVKRSLAYNESLPKGTILDYHHLITLRPNKNICGSKLEEFIGKELKTDVLENNFVSNLNF